MLYFNAPFCKSLATLVGKCFLEIVNKNVSEDHSYCKVFNMKTLKLSCWLYWIIVRESLQKTQAQLQTRKMKKCENVITVYLEQN